RMRRSASGWARPSGADTRTLRELPQWNLGTAGCAHEAQRGDGSALFRTTYELTADVKNSAADATFGPEKGVFWMARTLREAMTSTVGVTRDDRLGRERLVEPLSAERGERHETPFQSALVEFHHLWRPGRPRSVQHGPWRGRPRRPGSGESAATPGGGQTIHRGCRFQRRRVR